MPQETSDTLRDHLANERTFLAWVRTSLGIMAFGFVVEKFSLFIKEISSYLGKQHLNSSIPQQGLSPIFGIALIASGAIICLLAFMKYKIIERQIVSGSYKISDKLNVFLTASILLIGVLLVIYLALSV